MYELGSWTVYGMVYIRSLPYEVELLDGIRSVETRLFICSYMI